MRQRTIGKTLLFLSGPLLLCTMALVKDHKALSKEHEKITRQFSSVEHISSEGLSKLSSSEIIIFDVREPAEYEVSHIEGAIHIPPDIATDSFIEAYAERAQGKTAVFYCSVGQRSSNLANKVQDKLMNRGAYAVYNLEGGVFKWHNEERELQSTFDNLTPYIHPYNRYWGRMVNDSSALKYKNEIQKVKN